MVRVHGVGLGNLPRRTGDLAHQLPIFPVGLSVETGRRVLDLLPIGSQMRGAAVALRDDNRVLRFDDRETSWRVGEFTERLLVARRLPGIRVPTTTGISATATTVAAAATSAVTISAAAALLRPAARAAPGSFVGHITEVLVQRPHAD